MKNNVIIFCIAIALLFSCSNSNGQSVNNTKIEEETAKCMALKFESLEQINTNNRKCLSCLKDLLEKHSDNGKLYSFIANEYWELNVLDSAIVTLEEGIVNVFENTDLVIQKNVYSYIATAEYSEEDYQLIMNRFDEGKLTKSEIFDFGYLILLLKGDKEFKNYSQRASLTVEEMELIEQLSANPTSTR